MLPITSQKDNKDYWKFDILITKSEVNGLSKDSVVKMEQIKTISKLRIWDSLWKLDEEYVEIIESKFKKLFL